MAQSTSDFMKEQDKKVREQNPWISEFNYDELATPETIFDKIKKATHKIDVKKALQTITSNSSSKLNSFDDKTSTQQPISQARLEVEDIVTTSEPEIDKDDYSKDD